MYLAHSKSKTILQSASSQVWADDGTTRHDGARALVVVKCFRKVDELPGGLLLLVLHIIAKQGCLNLPHLSSQHIWPIPACRRMAA